MIASLSLYIITCSKERTIHINCGEDVYKEPDKTAAATAPGRFKLTECPAYVATRSTLQPYSATEAQLQTGYYEL